MIVLVNFANDLFEEKQKYQNITANEIGSIDKIYSFSPNDIDKDFYKNNEVILSNPRGNGYWLWKPYFIKKILETLHENDYLLYLDSGAYFINPLDSLISLQKELDQDILIFHNPQIEINYTKRDTFILLDCDNAKYTKSKQILGGINLWKKTDFTINFLNEWLKYGCDPRCITDIGNTLGFDNYREFKEHRHDQSIFSLLCKKYNLISFPDPTQYGNKERKILNDTKLKQIFHHTKGDKKKKTILDRLTKLLRKLK